MHVHTYSVIVWKDQCILDQQYQDPFAQVRANPIDHQPIEQIQNNAVHRRYSNQSINVIQTYDGIIDMCTSTSVTVRNVMPCLIAAHGFILLRTRSSNSTLTSPIIVTT